MTAHLQALAMQAFRVLGAVGVARIDFLIKAGGEAIYFNEINTMPGSLAFYLWEASGVPFDDLVSRVVSIAMEQHRTRRATQFTFEANLLRP